MRRIIVVGLNVVVGLRVVVGLHVAAIELAIMNGSLDIARTIIWFGTAAACAALYLGMGGAVAVLANHHARPRIKTGTTALNIGPGCFDDVEFLLDETLRAQFTAEALAAYDGKIECLFRIGVYVFKYLLLKLGPHFGARRRDARGRRAIRPELIIATALLYLSAGNTYESVAQSMRNGMTKAVVMRCVRMFNNAMVSEIAHG